MKLKLIVYYFYNNYFIYIFSPFKLFCWMATSPYAVCLSALPLNTYIMYVGTKRRYISAISVYICGVSCT